MSIKVVRGCALEMYDLIPANFLLFRPLTMCLRSVSLLLVLACATNAVAALPAPSQSVPRADPLRACRSLRGMEIPASAISLPTTGAYVRSASLVHDEHGEYCKVLGNIRPVDPSAHDIRFEVNLPTKWNQKAVHFGGGTFNGWLGGSASGLKRGPMDVAGKPVALTRGFATFGGDSGHHKRYFPLPDFLNTINASFAKNAEERRNFLHDALKKTHDAAVVLMERRYGVRPSRMFFLGGSTGGREAFAVVQRWPEDYDGVLGAYASWDQTELALKFLHVSQAMYAKGGFLTKAKTRLVARSVMDACDELDGLRDGIIANVAACHFDPRTLLRTADSSRKHLLSAEEFNTLESFAAEQRTAQPLWNGVQSIPGFNVFSGTDLTGYMRVLHHPQHHPQYFLNSLYYLLGERMLRNFLTGDARSNPLTFDTVTGGEYADELLPQSKANDESDADLQRFARHGGKFLILHGTADATVPTEASVMYYEMVQSKMSQQEVDGFLRLYLVPGFGHARGVFNAAFDALGVLDRWLDTGVAPEDLVVVDNNRRNHERSRPLCVYPSWPRYKGSGDVNAASSFVCVDR